MGEAQPERRVLIIGAEASMADLMCAILMRYRPDDIGCADSADAGVAAAAENPPDLIIVQIMMRNVDGFEVCARLKAHPALARVPVLLQAAMPPEIVYDRARSVGASGYLLQPYPAHVLLDARDAALSGGTFFPEEVKR